LGIKRGVNMKKVIILLVIVLMVFGLIACDPASFYFNYDELKDEIIAVELIDYDNTNAEIVKSKSEVLPFDFDKMEIIETLEVERIDDFLLDLSYIHFLRYWRHSDSAMGTSIRIIYRNGDFIIISATLIDKAANSVVGIYDSEGNVKEFIGGFASINDFNSLVNKYFVIPN